MVFQIIHWLTGNAKYESPETIALLEALLVCPYLLVAFFDISIFCSSFRCFEGCFIIYRRGSFTVQKKNTILICNMLKDENVIARVIMITEITYSARSSYSKMHRTDKYSPHSSVIWLVWLNGWVFVYELSGCGFESSCSHLNFKFCVSFEQGVPWHSGNYRAWIHSETPTWQEKNIQAVYSLQEKLQTYNLDT